MSDLLAARAQMGTSLAFHIIFASLGIGLPLLLCVAEGLALWRKDSGWMTLTRRWTKAFALLFAIGAVSGTILSFEIGLLWPTFTRFSGAIIGLPFALEGFAFFIEAIFLGLYLYGWERLSPSAHWLCSFPLWISGAASAWFIVSANSWMNTPTGFQITHGQVTGINPLQAIFNPSTPYETTHMLLAAYVATGFGVAAVYAVHILRGKRESYYRKGLMLAMAMGAIAIPLQIFDGDLSARSLADLQPAKLAAMEGVFHHAFGWTALQNGYIFTFVGLALVITRGGLAGRLLRRWGEHSLLIAGLVVLAAGLALLPWSTNLALLLVALGIVSAGDGVVTPMLSALLSFASPPWARGETLGLAQGVAGLGRAIGPLAAGSIFALGGPAAPFLLGSALVGLAALTALPALSSKYAVSLRHSTSDIHPISPARDRSS